MNLQELRHEQHARAGNHLFELYQACARRYVEAADLLEVDGPVIAAIRKSFFGTVYLEPLLDVFQCVCERYNNEIYSPQTDLWDSDPHSDLVEWTRYFHSVFIPVLASKNHLVRDVLRVMDMLPCEDPELAGAALLAEVTNMTLPSLP